MIETDDDQCRDDDKRKRHAEHRAMAEKLECFGNAGLRQIDGIAAIGEQLLHAAANEEGAERGEKRRDADARDQHRIEQPDDHATAKARDQRQRHGIAGEHQADKGEAGKIHRRADRQIDPAGGHRNRHRNGDDGLQGEIVGEDAR